MSQFYALAMRQPVSFTAELLGQLKLAAVNRPNDFDSTRPQQANDAVKLSASFVLVCATLADADAATPEIKSASRKQLIEVAKDNSQEATARIGALRALGSSHFMLSEFKQIAADWIRMDPTGKVSELASAALALQQEIKQNRATQKVDGNNIFKRY